MTKSKQLIIQPKVGKNQFTKFVNNLENEGVTMIYADPKNISNKKSKIQTIYPSTNAKYVVLDKEKHQRSRVKKLGVDLRFCQTKISIIFLNLQKKD